MNKGTMFRLLVIIPVMIMLPVFAGPPRSSVAATDACANPLFAPMLVSLRARTRVPLRLPLFVGGEYDAALYAEVGSVSSTRYVIRIGQNCERSYCPYGTVSGTKISKRTLRAHGRAIELAGGAIGYLTDGSKTLKDSVITWDQGRYRYAIAIYAAEPEAMVKIANSALSCDSQRTVPRLTR
jgi:hypothetical protein